MKRPTRTSKSRLPRDVFCCFSATLLPLLLISGCRSGGFRASHLPQEYRVGAKQKQTALNLSQMAGSVTSNTEIASGDLLEVTIATGREGESATPQLARVSSNGAVDIPLVGPVQVATLEPFDAGQRIATAAIERGIYRRPHVTLDVKTRATNKITVLGAVQEPGTYEIPRGASDLAAAIGAAGGLTEEASRQVDILRQASTFLAKNSAADAEKEINLASYEQIAGGRAAAQGGKRLTRVDLAVAPQVTQQQRRLNDRDVVMVLPRDKETIHVSGLVNAPGQFELPHDQDVHLLDAVAMAGGLRSPVADKVLIIRRLSSDGEPVVIRASLMRAKKNGAENLRIATGDTVTIERTPATVVVDSFNQLFRMSVGLSSRATIF